MSENDIPLILVDSRDNALSEKGKLDVHKEGLLHRAFSVFILRKNPTLEVLLQQRYIGKYHCGGLWANTCCGHPNPGIATKLAAKIRLKHEMGIDCELNYAGVFEYYQKFDNGLIEHEIDHVFYAYCDQKPVMHPKEVQDHKWVTIQDLVKMLGDSDHSFAVWVRPALAVLMSHLKEW